MASNSTYAAIPHQDPHAAQGQAAAYNYPQQYQQQPAPGAYAPPAYNQVAGQSYYPAPAPASGAQPQQQYAPQQGQYVPQQQYAYPPQQYGGVVGGDAGHAPQPGQPQAQPGVHYVGMSMPLPPAAATEVNMVWVQQQVDSTSCYIKILACLIIAEAIYSLAASANSMYTTGWDITSGVLLLLTGLLGLAAGWTNRTPLAKAYFYALIVITLIMTIGLIIVLAVIGANPCKDVHDNGKDDNSNKICEYSVDTIRAVLIIGSLITIGCCTCCTFCARMHLKNLELRDNGGVVPSAIPAQPQGLPAHA